MSTILNGFRNFVHTYPRIANCLVYGSFYVSAEFSQQHITRKILIADGNPKPYDWGAIGRYAIIGTLIYPNCLYVWYKWLDNKYIGTTTKVIAKKLVLDQFVLTPTLLVIFYTTMSILERREDIFEELRAKFNKTLLTSCIFWMPAQAINFRFISPTWRIVYMGVCSLIWVNIICWLKSRPLTTKKSEEK